MHCNATSGCTRKAAWANISKQNNCFDTLFSLKDMRAHIFHRYVRTHAQIRLIFCTPDLKLTLDKIISKRHNCYEALFSL